MIINTGRGKLIDTEALIEGLKSKKVGSAGLDVYEEEGEYFYEDRSDALIDDDVLARLLSFNNVIVTSHQAFFTREAMHNIARTTLDNIRDFYAGAPLTTRISARSPDDGQCPLGREGSQPVLASGAQLRRCPRPGGLSDADGGVCQ